MRWLLLVTVILSALGYAFLRIVSEGSFYDEPVLSDWHMVAIFVALSAAAFMVPSITTPQPPNDFQQTSILGLWMGVVIAPFAMGTLAVVLWLLPESRNEPMARQVIIGLVAIINGAFIAWTCLKEIRRRKKMKAVT